MAFVYVPVVQKQLDIFRETIWNNHRGRKQRAKELPCGVPEHIYNFPGSYRAENCAYYVTDTQLHEVSNLSGVFTNNDDYLDQELRGDCEGILPNVFDLQPKDAADAFIYLKDCFEEMNNSCN